MRHPGNDYDQFVGIGGGMCCLLCVTQIVVKNCAAPTVGIGCCVCWLLPICLVCSGSK